MTSNIIDFKPKPTQSHFIIDAVQEPNDMWHVTIDEFHDHSLPPNQVMLEIAEALIPIAGGLVRAAEENVPTERGRMIANISIYDNGHITFQSDDIDTEERRAWFHEALNRIRDNFISKKKRHKT
jgi:hypothetical protein